MARPRPSAPRLRLYLQVYVAASVVLTILPRSRTPFRERLLRLENTPLVPSSRRLPPPRRRRASGVSGFSQSALSLSPYLSREPPGPLSLSLSGWSLSLIACTEPRDQRRIHGDRRGVAWTKLPRSSHCSKRRVAPRNE